MATVYINIVYVTWKGNNIFLDPWTQIDTRLNLALEPGVGYIIYDKYNVTQSPAGTLW